MPFAQSIKDKENFPYVKRFYLFFILLSASTTYMATNVLSPNAIDPKLFLDDMIPLIPFTVIIYHLWYPGIIYLIYKLRFNKDLDNMLRDLALAMSICIFIYKLLPFCVSVRPETLGDGFFNWALKLTYMMDAPSSSMPSSHVLLSCICYHYASKNDEKYLAFYNTLIPIVTLTTKQHVIADVFVAIIFGYFILFRFKKDTKGGFDGIYYSS